MYSIFDVLFILSLCSSSGDCLGDVLITPHFYSVHLEIVIEIEFTGFVLTISFSLFSLLLFKFDLKSIFALFRHSMQIDDMISVLGSMLMVDYAMLLRLFLLFYAFVTFAHIIIIVSFSALVTLFSSHFQDLHPEARCGRHPHRLHRHLR